MHFPVFVLQWGYCIGSHITEDTIKEDDKMAHKISDACISCGACADTCPVSAIAQGDEHYEVNAELCIDCGACEDACPTGAISAE